MLEKPGAERITTAALAAHLGVSEAALYRHFASKAQMFEGLIEFIEQSVFTLVQQIVGRDVPEEERPAVDGMRQASRVISWCCSLASATRAWCASWWAMPSSSSTSVCRPA